MAGEGPVAGSAEYFAQKLEAAQKDAADKKAKDIDAKAKLDLATEKRNVLSEIAQLDLKLKAAVEERDKQIAAAEKELEAPKQADAAAKQAYEDARKKTDPDLKALEDASTDAARKQTETAQALTDAKGRQTSATTALADATKKKTDADDAVKVAEDTAKKAEEKAKARALAYETAKSNQGKLLPADLAKTLDLKRLADAAAADLDKTQKQVEAKIAHAELQLAEATVDVIEKQVARLAGVPGKGAGS